MTKFTDLKLMKLEDASYNWMRYILCIIKSGSFTKYYHYLIICRPDVGFYKMTDWWCGDIRVSSSSQNK